MGSWNHTCMLSNLHITHGTEVVAFVLLENTRKKSFCYGNAYYDVCPVPFYGEYDDYGGVENCRGFGLNIVVEAIRSKLYKFGQGPNPYHDCEVNKENFDIQKFFEADHEGRLGIEHFDNWDENEYDLRELQKKSEEAPLSEAEQFELDRLAAKIKKVDTFRPITHVVMHKAVVDDILENWGYEDYVGDGKGTHGYGKNYVTIKFKDVTDGIPDYVARTKKAYEDANTEGLSSFLRSYSMRQVFDWNDANHAARMMGYFTRGGGSESNCYGLVDVDTIVTEYAEAGAWDHLALFAREVLMTVWINNFMSFTRKHWNKTTGAGGQSQEHHGYRALNAAITKVLDAEKAEHEEYEDEDEDESEGLENQS